MNSSSFPFIRIYLQLSITISGAPFVAEITLDEKIFSLNVVIIFLVESKGISAILLFLTFNTSLDIPTFSETVSKAPSVGSPAILYIFSSLSSFASLTRVEILEIEIKSSISLALTFSPFKNTSPTGS